MENLDNVGKNSQEIYIYKDVETTETTQESPNVSKYLASTTMSSFIGKGVKYALGGLIWYAGPITIATAVISTGVPGIALAGTALGIVYGTNIVENTLSNFISNRIIR